MLLTLVRHGDADPSHDAGGDARRMLSALGREQASATGRALAERGVSPTHVWHSPLVRAVQTTELIVAALERAPETEERDDLLPDSWPSSLFAALRKLPADADVLVVGHMPFMAAAASDLLGLQIGGFATGAAFRLQLGDDQRARLLWRWVGRFID